MELRMDGRAGLLKVTLLVNDPRCTYGFVLLRLNSPAGSYRIRYFGDSKPLIGSISSFTGTSGTFTVA